MKRTRITAALLALCTLLSMTACADSSSSAADPAPTDSLSDALPDSAAESRAETGASAADSSDSAAETSADSAKEEESSRTDESSESSETAKTPETTASSSAAPQETVTLPAGEKPQLVKQMQCVSIPAAVSAVVPAGGSKAAVTAYDGSCYLVDLGEDRLVKKLKLICCGCGIAQILFRAVDRGRHTIVHAAIRLNVFEEPHRDIEARSEEVVVEEIEILHLSAKNIDLLISLLSSFLRLFDIYVGRTDRSLKSVIFTVTLLEANCY